MLEMIFMATGLLFNSWWILPLIGLMWSGQYKNWDAIYQALGMGPGGIGSVPENAGGAFTGPIISTSESIINSTPSNHWVGPAMESSEIYQRGIDEMLALQQYGLDKKGVPRLYSTSNNGNRSYGVNPSGFSFGGGGGAGSGSQGASAGSGASGGTGSTLAANPVNQIPVGSQLSGASLSAGIPAATPATISGGAITGGASTTPGWFSTAKGVLGNRQLMTGIISGIGAVYGQYDSKKKAGDAYDWQKGELENRRAYEQSRIDAQRNSPFGRMVPGLMQAVLGIYQDRLAKRGVNLNLSELFGAPSAPNGGGGDGGMQALIMSLMQGSR